MPTYSHSRLNKFENCPLSYYYSYVDKPYVEYVQGIEGFLGNIVHNTLEKLYKELMLTKFNSLNSILQYYEKQWKENFTEDIVIVKKGLKAEHYHDLGRKCVEDYYARHQPFDEDKTIACEKRVTIKLDSGHRLCGYIDRLSEQEEGHYVIHDYKTSGRLPIQDQADQDRQLALYQIGVLQEFNDALDVDLCWHYLAFDKDIWSKRSEEDLDELKKNIISLIGEVEKAEKKGEFPCKEGPLCSWCMFSHICPAKGHEVLVENLPVREFKKEAGVKIVNQYVKLNNEIAELSGKLEEIKQDAFSYADQHELEKIVGSDAALKIYSGKSFSLAGLSAEQKEELEKLLKDEKLLKRFQLLDTRALGNAVAKEELEKGAVKKIKKFGEEKENKSLRIVKK